MQDANLPSVGDETKSGNMVEIPDQMGCSRVALPFCSSRMNGEYKRKTWRERRVTGENAEWCVLYVFLAV
jgi:hypothetical protein